MTAKDFLIKKYQTYVDNMEYHLRVNGWALSPDEKKLATQRVQDFKEIISDINSLLR